MLCLAGPLERLPQLLDAMPTSTGPRTVQLDSHLYIAMVVVRAAVRPALSFAGSRIVSASHTTNLLIKDFEHLCLDSMTIGAKFSLRLITRCFGGLSRTLVLIV
jgi:hypothetical protein